MNEKPEDFKDEKVKADWKGAFLILLGLLAIIGAIKYGAPWWWAILTK